MAGRRTLVLSGATGYLGSQLARRLIANREPVLLLKRRASSLRRLVGIEVPTLDIDDGLDAQSLCRHGPPLAVIHMATCYGRHGESEAEIRAANVDFPRRLLAAATGAGANVFINTDTTLDAAVSVYSASKAQFRADLDTQSQAGGIPSINLRLQHFYGPGDDPSKFCTHVIRNCLAHVPHLDLTSGEQRRDFIYIDDVVAAYLHVIAEAPDAVPQCIDVGSGEAVALRYLVERIHRLTGSRTELRFGARPQRVGEAPLSVADTAALRALGWQRRIDLDAGLQLTIEHERYT